MKNLSLGLKSWSCMLPGARRGACSDAKTLAPKRLAPPDAIAKRFGTLTEA